MKKIFFLFLYVFLFISIYAENQYDFLEINNDISIENDLYKFLHNYFIERSSSFIKYHQRFVVNKKNPKRGNPKYYSSYGYSWSFFPDDRFYIVHKISINDITFEDNISDFLSEMGVIYKITISFNIFFSNCYRKNGDVSFGLKEIPDKIVLHRYSDKYLIVYEYESINYNWVLSMDEDVLVDDSVQ